MHKNKEFSIYLLPLICILAILPLIVRLAVYDPNLSTFPWFSSQSQVYDFFLYYKQRFFLYSILFALFLFIFYIISIKLLQLDTKKTAVFLKNGKLKFSFCLIPLACYAFLALFSTIFSTHSYYGYHGIYEQFESIFVLLGYCFLVYYAFAFISTEAEVRLLFHFLLGSSFVLCLLGFSQASKHDFFSTSIGKHLITPKWFWPNLSHLKFAFEPGKAYLSLYNPNYVGLYTALIIPFFSVLFLLCKQKKEKRLYGISILGLFLCLFSSSARNGFVAIIISFCFLLFFLRKKLKHFWKQTLLSFTSLLILFFILNAYTGNSFFHRLHTMFSENQTEYHALSSIVTKKDYVELTYKKDKLYIQCPSQKQTISFFVSCIKNAASQKNPSFKNAMPISLYQSNDAFFFSDPDYAGISLKVADFGKFYGFLLTVDQTEWYFSNQVPDKSGYYYYNAYGKFDQIQDADSAIFTRWEKLGSGRGYIWSRTIPLLKKYLFLGSGADTFSIVFPQNDYLNRSYHGYASSIISKPHNLYLQIGVQTGVLSLIAFLIFYGIYFFSCFRLYWKHSFQTYFSQVGLAIFIGTIGYMVSAFFNDSTLTVSPLFWALMGIGLAVNQQVQSSNE